jgi:hypothetical protein
MNADWMKNVFFDNYIADFFFSYRCCRLCLSKAKDCLQQLSGVYVFCSPFLRCTLRSLYSFLNSTHHQFCICECGVCWQWPKACILVLVYVIPLILWIETHFFFFLLYLLFDLSNRVWHCTCLLMRYDWSHYDNLHDQLNDRTYICIWVCALTSVFFLFLFAES